MDSYVTVNAKEKWWESSHLSYNQRDFILKWLPRLTIEAEGLDPQMTSEGGTRQMHPLDISASAKDMAQFLDSTEFWEMLPQFLTLAPFIWRAEFVSWKYKHSNVKSCPLYYFSRDWNHHDGDCWAELNGTLVEAKISEWDTRMRPWRFLVTNLSKRQGGVWSWGRDQPSAAGSAATLLTTAAWARGVGPGAVGWLTCLALRSKTTYCWHWSSRRFLMVQ